MKTRIGLIGLFFIGAWLYGCHSSAPIRSVVWRASNDFGDKPGNGIELRVDATGAIEGQFFVLSPEKPHDFSAAVSLPMRIAHSSAKEIVFSVDFGQGQVDHMRLAIPKGLQGSRTEGILQDQTGDGAPIRFIFRKTAQSLTGS